MTFAPAVLGVVLLSAAPRTVAHADSPQDKAQQAASPTAAHADHAQDKMQQAAADSGPVWVRTGGPPGGIGYDIRSRPDNPDYMLVTDIGSGLNVSIDRGVTWTPSNTGMDVNGVFAVTIDPRNNNIVWAGTQNWMGIFRSADGGRTWVRKSNGVTTGFGTSFRGFTVDPTNSDIVYAAGELSPLVWNNGVPLTYNGADLAKGMVYKTTDGGDHWTQIWSGDNLARYVWIDPRNTNVLYVSTGIFDRVAANAKAATNDFGGVGILKSTDGGQTWRVLNKANGLGNLCVSSLFMHPTNPDILVAGAGGGDLIGSGVYLTTNGGETWTRTLDDPISPSMAGTMPFVVVEISPVSPQVVYAATARSFYRSDDGARTWNRYVYPGSDQLPFWGPPGAKSGTPVDLEADRRDPMRVYANLYLGGNLLSTDGGATWVNTSRGYTGAMINSMAGDPGDPAIVYAVAAGGVFKSTNGGSDWQGLNDVASNFPAGMAAVAVSPSNGRDVLVSDAGTGSIWKSVEGGRGWIRVLDYSNTLTPGGVPSPNPSAVSQGFASIAYAPSNARVVYAGLAMAQCWPFVAPSQICDYPTLKTMHRSTDGGTTWEVTSGEGLGLRSILALAVHPRDPDIVYAGTGAPGLFKTVNGGRTWVSVNAGISALAIRSIAVDPSAPETVFVGTGGAAVFKSTDGGASWASTSAGLQPNAFIRVLLFDPTNPSTIWAGSQGDGAYRSVDAGATWVKISAGMRISDPQVMAISDDGGTLYAGTWGDGVYRLDLPVAPRVRAHPSSTMVAVGAQAGFTARASGTATPAVQWQVSPAGGSTWSDISGATSATYAFTTKVGDSGKQFRAVFTNSLGAATSDAATLTVTVAVSLSPATIRFAGTNTNGTLSPMTGAQAVTVSFAAPTSSTWTAAANRSWVQITNGSGAGSGTFTVGIVNPGNVLGTAASATATVTIASNGASNSPQVVAVDLTLRQASANAAPMGMVDTPLQSTTGVVGSIGVTGWAVDDVGISSVKLYRNWLSAFESPDNYAPAALGMDWEGVHLVYMGDADIVPGARPDVEGVYPTYPQASRAGWGYLLLTNMLPHIEKRLMYGGQGSLSIYAIATDVEGNRRLLGRSPTDPRDQVATTITMANDSAAKPFGAIDAPGQGQTVSGTLNNWGWALTPDTNTTGGETGDIVVPTDGKTIWVWIDGAPVGHPQINLCRGSSGVNPTVPAGQYCDDDVANIFGNPTPQATFAPRLTNDSKYRNLDAARGAIGVYSFDTRTLSNGRHSIVWSVTDSAGRVDGIGSRDFIVLNSGSSDVGRGASDVGRGFSPGASGGAQAPPYISLYGPPSVTGRTGFDVQAPLLEVPADDTGVRHVRLAALDRLELWLGAVDGGHLVANGTLRDLPPGSRLDLATGLFTWTPGVAYFGTYRLAFVRGSEHIAVDVTIRPVESPTPGEAAIRMFLDVPVDGAVVSGPLVVAGWALDPQASIGSGIGTVHVWAQRRDQPGAWPEFLGAATLGVARSDVAAVHGASFGTAGFNLTSDRLAPGEYEVTAFAWNRRTARWEDARTVRVAVR